MCVVIGEREFRGSFEVWNFVRFIDFSYVSRREDSLLSGNGE